MGLETGNRNEYLAKPAMIQECSKEGGFLVGDLNSNESSYREI